MSNLAQALSDQGKYAEAEEMHREILALKEKSLWKEHPNTLASTNNPAQNRPREIRRDREDASRDTGTEGEVAGEGAHRHVDECLPCLHTAPVRAARRGFITLPHGLHWL
jgi:hypothetical protein